MAAISLFAIVTAHAPNCLADGFLEINKAKSYLCVRPMCCVPLMSPMIEQKFRNIFPVSL